MFKTWRSSAFVSVLGLLIGACIYAMIRHAAGSALAVAVIAGGIAATELGSGIDPDMHMMLVPTAVLAGFVAAVADARANPGSSYVAAVFLLGLLFAVTYFVADEIAKRLDKPVFAVCLLIFPVVNVVTGPFAPLYVCLYETAPEPLP